MTNGVLYETGRLIGLGTLPPILLLQPLVARVPSIRKWELLPTFPNILFAS